jgi:predicted alpha/beta hydrolase family esterase
MILKTVSTVIIVLIFLLLLILATFQENLIYPGIKRPGIILKEPFEEIHDSFYKKGSNGKIWVFFGGNNSLPGDYINIINNMSIDGHSFLIITYPGYNNTQLKPNPKTTYEKIDNCLNAIKKKGYKDENINFICYSIGCAVAINYLSKKKILIKNLVLFAPFWSLDEIVHSKYPFPIFVIKNLLNHNWENEKLKDIHHKIDVTIVHGKKDKLINYNHSERLSKIRKSKLILTEEDDHTSISNRISEYIN